MKALMANFSLGREVWDRVKSKFFSRDEGAGGISLEVVDTQEPAVIGEEWLKIRAVISGISGMDEGMMLHHDLAAFGPFLSFPFVPGSENMGIVTESALRLTNVGADKLSSGGIVRDRQIAKNG